MLAAAQTACAGSSARTGWWPALLGAALLGLGWFELYRVAARYDANQNPVARRLGMTLQWLALPCATGAMVAWTQLRTDRCGRTAGAAGAWEGWLFLAAVVLIMAGVLLARTGTGWIATAAVVVADAACLVVFLGVHTGPYRTEIVVLLSVHGGCTAVTSWWARQLRDSPAQLRAKASEASRVLATSWLILALPYLAGGRRAGQLLTENTLVGLFVVTGVGLVFGPGYTRYAEARADPAAVIPASPDLLTRRVTRLSRAAGRAAGRARSLPRKVASRRTAPGRAAVRPTGGDQRAEDDAEAAGRD